MKNRPSLRAAIADDEIYDGYADIYGLSPERAAAARIHLLTLKVNVAAEDRPVTSRACTKPRILTTPCPVCPGHTTRIALVSQIRPAVGHGRPRIDEPNSAFSVYSTTRPPRSFAQA